MSEGVSTPTESLSEITTLTAIPFSIILNCSSFSYFSRGVSAQLLYLSKKSFLKAYIPRCFRYSIRLFLPLAKGIADLEKYSAFPFLFSTTFTVLGSFNARLSHIGKASVPALRNVSFLNSSISLSIALEETTGSSP